MPDATSRSPETALPPPAQILKDAIPPSGKVISIESAIRQNQPLKSPEPQEVEAEVLPPHPEQVGFLEAVKSGHPEAMAGAGARLSRVQEASVPPFRREEHLAVAHTDLFTEALKGIEGDGGGGGPRTPETYQGPEWSRSPERLPSIEEVREMETFEEVVNVMWEWHALADRDPGEQWKENEAIMDAAMDKFSRMADLTPKDLSAGKALVGIYQNIKRLREETEPTFIPEVYKAYEDIAEKIRGRDRELGQVKFNEETKIALQQAASYIETQLSGATPEDQVALTAQLQQINQDIATLTASLVNADARKTTLRTEIDGFKQDLRQDPRMKDIVDAREYEYLTTQLKEINQALQDAQNIQNHQSRENEIGKQITTLQELLAKAKVDYDSAADESPEKQAAYEKTRGHAQLIMMYERERGRLPVNVQILQIKEQADEHRKQAGAIDKRLAELDEDEKLGKDAKYDSEEREALRVRYKLEKTQLENNAKDKDTLVLTILKKVNKEIQQDEVRSLEKRKTEIEVSLKEERFKSRVELDEEYRKYSLEWEKVLEGAGKKGEHEGPEIAETDEKSSEKEPHKDLRSLEVIAAEYRIAENILSFQHPENYISNLYEETQAAEREAKKLDREAAIIRRGVSRSRIEAETNKAQLERERVEAEEDLAEAKAGGDAGAQKLAERKIKTLEEKIRASEQTIQILNEDLEEQELQAKEREGEAARKRKDQTGKLMIIKKYLGLDMNENIPDDQVFDGKRIEDLAKAERKKGIEDLDYYLKEAHKRGMLKDLFAKFDHDYAELKESLAPHPSGWNRKVVAPDFEAKLQEEVIKAANYLDQKTISEEMRMLGLKNDWGERTGGGEPFTRENINELGILLPLLQYRFHLQAQDYIKARKLEDESRPGQGRFPARLTNRSLAESEWSIRNADKRDRQERGRKIVKEEMVESSGSGYYYVNATNIEEIELAIEYFVGVKLAKEIHQDPNKIFQEREKFVIALGEAAARYGLSNEIKDLMLKFEMQVFAYSAELFNRNNQPELVAQVLQVAGDYSDGLGRWALLPQLLGGDLAAALFLLDRTAGSEILFRPWGSKNQFGNETHKYLMLHGIARDVVAEKLMGIEVRSESVDTDLLRDEFMEQEFLEKGRTKDYIRKKVAEVRKNAETVEKEGGRLTEDDYKILRLGMALERMESNVLTLKEVQEQRAGGDGVIRLTGESGIRRNLEKLGRYQSKEDFMLLYEKASRGANLIELERKDAMGEPMSTREIQLLDLGRIQRKLDQGARLLKLERKEREGASLSDDEQRSLDFLRGEKAKGRALTFRELKASERDTYMDWKRKKRHAVNMAIQFQSMTQHIAVRGDPSYVCGNGVSTFELSMGKYSRLNSRLKDLVALDVKERSGGRLSDAEKAQLATHRRELRDRQDLEARESRGGLTEADKKTLERYRYEEETLRLGGIQQRIDNEEEIEEADRRLYESRVGIIIRERGERGILVERREGHFVPKHKSKKFVQYADNWAKIYWGEHLRIKAKGEIKGWWDKDMTDNERKGLIQDVQHLYDPFWDSENKREIVLVSPQEIEKRVKQHKGSHWDEMDDHHKSEEISKEYTRVNKDAIDKIRANWRLLSAEDRLKSLLDGKGDKDLPGGSGLANDVSLSQPGRFVIPKPTETPGTRHIDHRDFWRTFTEAEREIEAAKVWQLKQKPVFDRLVKGAKDAKPEELEDLLQEVRFYKRRVARQRAVQELQANGFRATLKDHNGVEIKQKIAVKDANGNIVTEEKPVDVMFASNHALGQFLGIDYIAQQNEIRNQILSDKITKQARQILDGTLRWEDADPLALLRIEIDPRLELKLLGGKDAKNLENRMRTMLFAKCHESFYGTKRIEEELREVFHDPDNVDGRIAWHWTNEHIGSKRVVNLAEWISVYQNSLSRRMRTNIPYILQPITSMPEMFGVSPMGVMGIPMMIIRRDTLEENFYQEILDPPELKSYGFAVAGSVKVRDTKITHVTEQGLPKEGTQEKPTNDADKWWEHAQEFVDVFRDVSFAKHFPHEKTIEKYLRETLGRLEQECRFAVTTIRFARTAGEEMLVEKRAMFSENGDYLLDVDTKGSTDPPPVSGSRSMVNDMIYNHLLWLLSDAGRKAYGTEVPFYSQFNWRIVQWLVGKITL